MRNPQTCIKYCGLRRREDIHAVNAAGAAFAGFIMSERFWRYVDPETVARLHKELDPAIKAVGVFVDEPVEYVAEQLNNGTIDIAQLHGHEDDAYIARLRELIGSAANSDAAAGRGEPKITKAFKIQTAEDIARAVASTADYILLDSGTGTGVTFDWSLMTAIDRPYFFAGGLTPDNVYEAVCRFHPFAVDVSSGTETEKVKDPEKIAAFAANVRKANMEGESL